MNDTFLTAFRIAITGWFCTRVETDTKKSKLAQYHTITKKSTFFGQSLWKMAKMTSSRVGDIALIFAWLDKNCGFFIYGQILSQFGFFCISL